MSFSVVYGCSANDAFDILNEIYEKYMFEYHPNILDSRYTEAIDDGKKQSVIEAFQNEIEKIKRMIEYEI